MGSAVLGMCNETISIHCMYLNVIRSTRTSHCSALFFEFKFSRSQRSGQPKFLPELVRLQHYKVVTTERSICTVTIWNLNYRCLIKWLHVTCKCSSLQRCNLHHQVLYKQTKPLLGKVNYVLPTTRVKVNT